VCILLVEDEPLIRENMSESLMEAGFDVVGAGSGDEALSLFEARPGHFTLLVTDFHMPGEMDGAAIAARLRDHAPDLPVIIASGRPEIFKPTWRTALGYVLLTKPYRPRELVGLARSLLV
jgi:DNA-binding response OmpR family regulator